MQYLPSRKIVILAIGILVVGGFWFTLRDRNAVTKKNADNATNAENLLVQGQSDHQDSDNDGLEDWEELLFGTDPHNPDSDRDGLLDGEEFTTEKNYPEIDPREIGDPLSNFSGSTQGGNFFVESSSNFTDTLSRETAYRYGLLSQTGEIDDKTKEQLVNSIASDLPLPLPHDIYTEEDITIEQSTAPDKKNAYVANILLLFYGEHSDIYDVDPIALLNAWFETEDSAVMEKLSALQETYTHLHEDLIALSVPTTFVPFHLILANNFYHIAKSLEDMTSAASDPVKSILATTRYTVYRAERSEAILALTDYYNRLLLSLNN